MALLTLLQQVHFIRPEWFFALIPLLVLLVLFYKVYGLSDNWAGVIDPHLLKHLLSGSAKNNQKNKKRITTILGIILLLLVISLSGPSFYKQQSPIYQLEKLQVILLDASPSTYTTDIKPSRFKRSILLIKQLLKQHKEGRIMLIAFSGEPYVISPPTSDAKPILNLLDGLTQDTIPSQGSRLDLALEFSKKILSQHQDKQVNILLFTDAHKVSSKSLDIAKALNEKQQRLSIIAVASDKKIPLSNANGLIKDKNGALVVSNINERLLTLLAKQGGGSYQLLSNDVLNIAHYLASIKNIDNLENTKSQDKSISQWIDSGIYLVFLLIPLVLLLFRQGYLLVMIFAVGLMLKPDGIYAQESVALPYAKTIWQTQDQQAKIAYDKQDYKQAAELFTDLSWRANALYKAGDYKQAAELFKQLGKFYNYGNALAKLEEYKPAIEQYLGVEKTDKNYQHAQNNLNLIKKIQQQKQQQQQAKKNQEKNDKDKQKGDKKNKQEKGDKKDKGDKQEKGDKQDKGDKQEKGDKKNSDDKVKSDKKDEENKEKSDKKDEENKENTQSKLDKAKQEAKKKQQIKESHQSQLRKQKLKQVFKKVNTKPIDILKQKFLIEQRNRKQNNSQFLNTKQSDANSF